jgi:hypothetical protein
MLELNERVYFKMTLTQDLSDGVLSNPKPKFG